MYVCCVWVLGIRGRCLTYFICSIFPSLSHPPSFPQPPSLLSFSELLLCLCTLMLGSRDGMSDSSFRWISGRTWISQRFRIMAKPPLFSEQRGHHALCVQLYSININLVAQAGPLSQLIICSRVPQPQLPIRSHHLGRQER